MDSRWPQRVEDQCLRTVQELAGRRPAAPCREPRPGLGHSRSGRGCRGQGALRLVRRTDRLHLRDEGPHTRLGKVLEERGYEDGALYRQGQHRLPLHCFPLDAQGPRRLHPSGERARERVPEPRGREDLHVAQLGRLAARIPRGVPRQGGRAALRALRQCPRDQGQRLYVEGLPGPQQQRAGGRAGQLRESCPGAHAEVLRRQGARLGGAYGLRPRDDRRHCLDPCVA